MPTDTLTLFYIVVGISLFGIIYVIILIKKDTEENQVSIEKLDPGDMTTSEYLSDRPVTLDLDDPALDAEQQQPEVFATTPKKASLFSKIKLPKLQKKKKEPKPPKVKSDKPKLDFGFLANLKDKLKFGKKGKNPYEAAIPEPTSFPDFSSKAKPTESQEEQKTGTASLKIPEDDTTDDEPPMPALSTEEVTQIEENTEVAMQLEELQKKYDRLEDLFTEKSGKLDQTEKKLSDELKARKDFNKVKDILEKELKEIKDRSKEIKHELSASKSENDSYKKRIAQLEEKSTQLEKEMYTKEKETEELIKDLEAKAETENAPEAQTEEAPVEPETEPEAASEPEPDIEPSPTDDEPKPETPAPEDDKPEKPEENKSEDSATIELASVDEPAISYEEQEPQGKTESSSEPVYIDEIDNPSEQPIAIIDPDDAPPPAEVETSDTEATEETPQRIKMPEDPYEDKETEQGAEQSTEAEDSPPIYIAEPPKPEGDSEEPEEPEAETDFLSLSPDPINSEEGETPSEENNPEKDKETP